MTAPQTIGALKLVASGGTDIGKRRSCNEDRFLVRDELGLYLVADGAGGHAAGDLAAERALQAIADAIGTVDRGSIDAPGAGSHGIPRAARLLASAVMRANRGVRALAERSKSDRGVGSTLVAALFSPRSALLHVAHVGDSRCYRLRGGHLEQLTQDHSLITDVLAERPDLPDEVLARLPKHVVTRALGMSDKLRVSMRSYAVVEGDRYLLCTDGLSGPLPPQRIARVLGSNLAPSASVRALIDMANQAGGPDNITALVIACEQGAGGGLPIDATAPPEPDSHYESDPELLILGIEEIELSSGASDELIQALGSLMEKRGR
jgi:PPM family protein phosphatase